MADDSNTFPSSPTPRTPAEVARTRSPIASATQPSFGALKPQHAALRLADIDSPPLEEQDGVIAADVLTLRLAAEKVTEVSGRTMVIPTIASGTSPVLETLARVVYEPSLLKVTATIDTGKLGWRETAQESAFTDYQGHRKQAVLLGSGQVAQFGDDFVSNEEMVLPDGRSVTLWVATVNATEKPTRYGLVEQASAYTAGFNSAPAGWANRVMPAAQIEWKAQLPEIVTANPSIIEQAEQTVRFAIDYTGARAYAETKLVMRGMSRPTPTVTFGDETPTMYWLTEVDGSTPFAVSVSTPEAWLEVGQRPNFDFSDDMKSSEDPSLEQGLSL